MFENPRRDRQARNFTTNVPKILVLKSSSEQIFSRKLPLGAPVRKKEGASEMFPDQAQYLFIEEVKRRYTDVKCHVKNHFKVVPCQ